MRAPAAILLTSALLLSACGSGGGGGSGGADGTEDPPATNEWRSALLPADWTPATTDAKGRFLHDFSYAGYRNGEAALPDSAGRPVHSVLTHGADPTGAVDSCAAIRSAIAAATGDGGGVVLFPRGRYRCEDSIDVTASGVVLRGDGPTESLLWFTRHEGMSYRSHLRFAGSTDHGRDRPLAADTEARGFDVLLDDVSGLAVGDDVAIGGVITDDFVADHGMTGVWKAFDGTWQPFFRRTVVAIDAGASPARVTLDVPLRYRLRTRDGASLRRGTVRLAEVGVEDLGLANATAWDTAWANDQTHVLEFAGTKDSWVRNVRSFESPESPDSGPGAGEHLASGGILVRHSKRVTVAGCRMELAQHRGGGGNGYLFEVRQSSEILFRDCEARRGRHNFIQNWGFGVSGCVWLRCVSREGQALNSVLGVLVPIVGASEYHHSLATANLVDSCVVDDGWSALNRGSYSSGAGHTATECVFWNTTGTGLIRSSQFGHGYVIGTGPEIGVLAPDGDLVEGEGEAVDLRPASLHGEQFERRTGRPPSDL